MLQWLMQGHLLEPPVVTTSSKSRLDAESLPFCNDTGKAADAIRMGTLSRAECTQRCQINGDKTELRCPLHRAYQGLKTSTMSFWDRQTQL